MSILSLILQATNRNLFLIFLYLINNFFQLVLSDYVISSLIFNNKLFRFQYFRNHTINAIVFIKAKHILRSAFRLAFSPPLTQILGMVPDIIKKFSTIFLSLLIGWRRTSSSLIVAWNSILGSSHCKCRNPFGSIKEIYCTSGVSIHNTKSG